MSSPPTHQQPMLSWGERAKANQALLQQQQQQQQQQYHQQHPTPSGSPPLTSVAGVISSPARSPPPARSNQGAQPGSLSLMNGSLPSSSLGQHQQHQSSSSSSSLSHSHSHNHNNVPPPQQCLSPPRSLLAGGGKHGHSNSIDSTSSSTSSMPPHPRDNSPAAVLGSLSNSSAGIVGVVASATAYPNGAGMMMNGSGRFRAGVPVGEQMHFAQFQSSHHSTRASGDLQAFQPFHNQNNRWAFHAAASQAHVAAMSQNPPQHGLHSIPSQPEQAAVETRDLLVKKKLIDRQLISLMQEMGASPSHAASTAAAAASVVSTAAVAPDTISAPVPVALSSAATILDLTSPDSVNNSGAGSSNVPTAAPSPASFALSPALPPTSPSSPTLNSLKLLLTSQNNLLERSLSSLQSTLSSFFLLRDVYLSAASAERRVRAQLALDSALAHTRKLGLEAMNDSVLNVLASALGAERVALYFAGKTHLFGLEPSEAGAYDEFRHRRFPNTQFLAGLAFVSGEAVFVPSKAYQHPAFDNLPDSLQGTHSHSVMCVPVMDEQEGVLAVIQVVNKKLVRVPPPPPPIHPLSVSAQHIKFPFDANVSNASSQLSNDAALFPDTSSSNITSSPQQPISANARRATSTQESSATSTAAQLAAQLATSPRHTAQPPASTVSRPAMISRMYSTPVQSSPASIASTMQERQFASDAPTSSLSPHPIFNNSASPSPDSSSPEVSTVTLQLHVDTNTGANAGFSPSNLSPSTSTHSHPALTLALPSPTLHVNVTHSLSAASGSAASGPSANNLGPVRSHSANPTRQHSLTESVSIGSMNSDGEAAESNSGSDLHMSASPESAAEPEFSFEDLDLLCSLAASLCAPLKRFLPEIVLDQFNLSSTAAYPGEQLVGALGQFGGSTIGITQPQPIRGVTGESSMSSNSSSVSSSRNSSFTPELSPRKYSASANASIGGGDRGEFAKQLGAAGITTVNGPAGVGGVSIFRDDTTSSSARASITPSNEQIKGSAPVSVPANQYGHHGHGSGTTARGRDSPLPLVPASLPTMSRLAFSPLPGSSSSSSMAGSYFGPSSLSTGTTPQSQRTAAAASAADVAGVESVRSLVQSYAVNETNLAKDRSSAVRASRARTLSFQWPAGTSMPSAPNMLAAAVAASGGSSALNREPAEKTVTDSPKAAGTHAEAATAVSAPNSTGATSESGAVSVRGTGGSATPILSPSHQLSHPTHTYGIPQHPSQRVFSIEDLHSLSFNVFDYSETELVRFTVGVFRSMGLIDEFKISMNTLQRFLLGVVNGYHKNPFHNFIHGFSVMHFAYYTLRHSTAANHLLPHDVLALLVSSLCHDLDHPGNTNAFEINSKSQLALLYNDQHVLENHHCCTTFTLLRHDKSNIFKEIVPEIRNQLRTCMIKAILCTDMSEHFSELKKLDEACVKRNATRLAMNAAAAAAQTATSNQPSAAVSQFPSGQNSLAVSMEQLPNDRHASWPSLSSSAPHSSPLMKAPQTPLSPNQSSHTLAPPTMVNMPTSPSVSVIHQQPVVPLPFDPDQEKDRQALVNIIIHSADLSGQVFPTHIARQWEERISREFDAQARKEIELNLPVAPFMKGLDSLKTRAKLQVSFIEFVLMPWWRSVARLLSPALDPALRLLQGNKEYFERLASSLPDEPSASPQSVGANGVGSTPPKTPSSSSNAMNHATTNPPGMVRSLSTPSSQTRANQPGGGSGSGLSSPVSTTTTLTRANSNTDMNRIVNGANNTGTANGGNHQDSPSSSGTLPPPVFPQTPVQAPAPSPTSAATAPASAPATPSSSHKVASSVLKSVPMLLSNIDGVEGINSSASGVAGPTAATTPGMATLLERLGNASEPSSAGRKRSSTEVSRMGGRFEEQSFEHLRIAAGLAPKNNAASLDNAATKPAQ